MLHYKVNLLRTIELYCTSTKFVNRSFARVLEIGVYIGYYALVIMFVKTLYGYY